MVIFLLFCPVLWDKKGLLWHLPKYARRFCKNPQILNETVKMR